MLYRTFGKRFLDVVLAASALVLLAPALLLIALLIKLTSKGPVLYVQERIGKNRQPFQFIKFRTMVPEAEKLGAGVLCVEGDPRVTTIGRFLRRYSLDELPQLVNVLRGEMSIIGPRPGLDYQVRSYSAFQLRRLGVLPGISGLAQVNGRNSISWDRRIQYDVEYTERLSLLLDLQIVVRTFGAVLNRRGLIAEKDYFKEKAAQSRGPR